MDPKKSKNSSPRIKVIQKLYNSLMNPDAEINYPKSQYKKFIKDVVKGTLERSELIEGTVSSYLSEDINLAKTDKILKIILFAAIFEFMGAFLAGGEVTNTISNGIIKKVFIFKWLSINHFIIWRIIGIHAFIKIKKTIFVQSVCGSGFGSCFAISADPAS